MALQSAECEKASLGNLKMELTQTAWTQKSTEHFLQSF